MSLEEHLEELRRRLIISIVAILVTTTALFFVSDTLLKVLLTPSGGLQLKAFSLTDGFLIKFRIALYGGILLAFPAWAYHVIRYISPGLLENERRIIFPALAFSLGLFALGVAFGYAMLSGMIHALLQFFPKEVDLLPSADDYISLVLFFLLAAGAAFQLPTIIIVLVQLKLLNSTFLRKQRRYAYFILFAFAEIITPVSDPIVAPMIVMVPLVLLYELSIILARRIEGRRRKEEQNALLVSGSAMPGEN
jgi:sec-independent protein translocase protein TatC